MKIYKITYTKGNIDKCKNHSKTMTRRVIEKIDHYKNIKPGDVLITTKNRFSKDEVDRNVCVKTWTENVQDISIEDIHKEGIIYPTNVETKYEFTALWDSINIDRGYSWKSNPRVRVIEFKQFVSWQLQPNHLAKRSKHDE